MSAFRTFIDWQRSLSHRFDRWLPERYTVDGNRYFLDCVLPELIRSHQVIVDVGGGKNPYVPMVKKRPQGTTVIGIDIDANELRLAPPGAYDRTIVADFSSFRQPLGADLVICQSLLEHVRDVSGAFSGMKSVTKPGGRVALFLPSRRAPFALLNRWLPQGLKRRLLFAFFPHMERDQGFPAYYNQATPKEYHALANRHGFEVERYQCFFMSIYFSWFFPLYLLWRTWILAGHAIAGDAVAETFLMVLRRTDSEKTQP